MRVAIYGAGGFAARVFTAIERNGGYEVAHITSQNGGGSSYFASKGIPILTSAGYDYSAVDAVIVAIFNCNVDLLVVEEMLLAQGAKQLIFPWNLLSLLGSHSENYWMGPIEADLSEMSKILQDRLADDESKSIFSALMTFRRTGKLADHPPVSYADQYWPIGLFPAGPIERFVDVGAFTGDTLRDLFRLGVDVRETVAFEPDPLNFERLLSTVDELGVKATCINAGVGAVQGVASFAANASGGTVGSGNDLSAIIPLDSTLRNVPIDYVKMDVEGYEMEALSGMSRLIRTYMPKLAISIYHKPGDIIRIPSLILQQYPEYKIYIRQHRYSCFDTVLYCQVS
jgi:FkbM family methyltransferase